MTQIKRALISVSDKTGVVPFAQALNKMGVEILSIGGDCKIYWLMQVFLLLKLLIIRDSLKC